MDRGAWRATVHGVTQPDMIEQLTHYTCISGFPDSTGGKELA